MVLQMKQVHKSIGVTEILNDVSFIIEDNEKVALVGVNGAGKTSVFRLITGAWSPDGGEISSARNMKLGYLPQLSEDDVLPEDEEHALTLYGALDRVFDPIREMETQLRAYEHNMGTLSGDALEAVLKKYDTLNLEFERAGGYEINSRLKGVLRGLGFSDDQWDQPFFTLSGGQKTRALLGKLLLDRSDLLLLDEPTNHLDIESVAWLEDYLRNFNGAVLIISHDRYFMDRVVSKTIEIENKQSVVYNGNYSTFVKQKAINRALAEKAYAQNQKTIKHHEEVIKTIRGFGTEAAIIRAKSREKLLAKMERVDKPAEDPATMRLKLTPRLNSGNDVLSVEDLTMGFGENILFEDINFEIKKGDKTALIGPNGIGKSTLLKLITKDLLPLSGRIREGVNVRVGYYDQSQALALDESKTIFEELADTYPRMTQTQIRTTLGSFMFIGDDVFKPISALSGGERGRVQLAKIMLNQANFLILDEPTNHLDLFSKEILEASLREYTGTLFYISHDRYFINNTANHILELTDKGITGYAGNYDYYLEKKAQLEAMQDEDTIQEMAPALSQKEEYELKKEQEAAERKRRNRLEKVEAEIHETETRIKACDDLLATESIGTSATEAQKIFSERSKLEENLTSLLEEWETLH